MKRAAKVDANHADMVACFRALGAQVLDLHAVGKGCPDILVALPPRGGSPGWENVLVEIKDGSKPPSAQKLTAQQRAFFTEWRGPRVIVNSVGDALDLVRYGTKG